MSRETGKLVPGLIVRAEVADSAGRNPKVRPLVLISGEDDTPPDQPLIGVAISSTLPAPLPGYYVLLPWTRSGHPRTGLKKNCAAVCNWLPKVSRSEPLDVMGRVPEPIFEEIRQKVRAFHNAKSV